MHFAPVQAVALSHLYSWCRARNRVLTVLTRSLVLLPELILRTLLACVGSLVIVKSVPHRRTRAPPKAAGEGQQVGFGGPKRAGKRNDATSAADMEGFKPSRSGRGRGRGGAGGRGAGRGAGRGGVAGGAARKRAVGSKPNRPGKARRESTRS